MATIKENAKTPPVTKIKPPTMFREGYLDSSNKNIAIPKDIRDKNSAFRTVERVIEKSRHMIEKLERVRQADEALRGLDEIGKKLRTYKFWKSQFGTFTEINGKGIDAAKNEAERIDAEIKRTFRKTADKSVFSREIWGIVRSLPEQSKRTRYVRDLIRNPSSTEDRELAESILAASGKLTGLSEDSRQALRREFEKKYFTDELMVRDNLLKAVDILERGYNAAVETISEELNTPEVREAEQLEEQARKAREELDE